MSDADSPAPGSEQSVLASLPHTRPQRPSARRAAARARAAKRASGVDEKTAATTAKPPRAKRAHPATPAKPSAPPRPSQGRQTQRSAQATPPRAPRQGFASEDEPAAGRSVSPPSSAELAASVVEALGELAQNGLTSAGRLLREALGRHS